jgi:hypothetical protein
MTFVISGKLDKAKVSWLMFCALFRILFDDFYRFVTGMWSVA